MTIWTNLPDAALEPGKPIRSIDGLALRNNPVAITEGSSGAPKIQTAAIQDSAVTTAKLANDNVTTAKLANDNVTTAKLANDNVTTAKLANDNVTTAKLEANERMTTANVLAATAAASVGSVGTYAFAVSVTYTSSTEGETRAGSGLRFANGESVLQGVGYGGIFSGGAIGGALTGTWRCMGRASTYNNDPTQVAATLFLRIS